MFSHSTSICRRITGLTHAANPPRDPLAQRRSESIPAGAGDCRPHLQKAALSFYKVSRDFHVAFQRLRSSLSFGLIAPCLCATLRDFPITASWKRPDCFIQSLLHAFLLQEVIVGVEGADKPDVVFGGSLRERHQRGVASDLFEHGLDWKHGKGQWLAVERFGMSQSTADSRVIATGAKFGRVSGAEYSETLDFYTAAQQVLHARELVKALNTL